MLMALHVPRGVYLFVNACVRMSKGKNGGREEVLMIIVAESASNQVSGARQTGIDSVQ